MRSKSIFLTICLLLAGSIFGQEPSLVQYQTYIAKADTAFDAEDYEEAARSYSDALEISKTIFNNDSDIILEGYVAVGVCYTRLEKEAETRAIYEEAYKIIQDNQLQDSIFYDHVLLKLAEFYFASGEYQDALRIAKLRLANLKEDPENYSMNYGQSIP